MHLDGKKEVRHELDMEEVEDYGALLKELKELAEKSFGIDEFKMVSRGEGVALDFGDDLEVEMDYLEGGELHINIIETAVG